MPTTVTTKGQVTIPLAVRNRLGLRPGDPVSFELADDGQVVLLKAGAPDPARRFRKLLGVAGPGPTTDEIMSLLRDDPGA